MGFCPVPGSKSECHILENIEIYDFELTDDEMNQIATLNKHQPIYQATEQSKHMLATTIPDVDGEK